MCFYSSPFDFRTKVAVNLFSPDANEVCKVMQGDKMSSFGHRGFSFEQCFFSHLLLPPIPWGTAVLFKAV